MLTPPLSTAPFCSAAPERMLPVCPGWMPTPVACLLNRPETTFSFVLSGAMGCRLLLSSMPSPVPFAHQWFGLIPLPMNSAAKRLGDDCGVSPAHAGRDSSQGRPIATPTPRSTVRRLIRETWALMGVFLEVQGFEGVRAPRQTHIKNSKILRLI